MNLDYAVDRLYGTGWYPVFGESDYSELSDGRRYPTPALAQRYFAAHGLQLVFKQNFIYSCCRATWAPVGDNVDHAAPADETHGTVMGASESEAAVYALAQLREHTGAAMPVLA